MPTVTNKSAFTAGPSSAPAEATCLAPDNNSLTADRTDARAFLLSVQKVSEIIDTVSKQNEALLTWHRGVKKNERKTDSVHLGSFTAHNANRVYREESILACKKIEQAVLMMSNGHTSRGPHFANVVKESHTDPSRRIALLEGELFPISGRKQIVMGPTTDN
ncbi:hypothetical protein QAD02_007864 [Eretmocerus hayati]|uniref:Uncharacterized protein n=1 Tax=Eretmocerus hayati TaxID=131215 RepID=A0ACC2N555_9HYME|nr:hypothetical protein QAD02_007864 [Eretmocerus hayati]